MSPTVHLAFDETYYLEQACKNYLITMASVGGRRERLAEMPTSVQATASKYYNPEMLDLYAKRHFYAYWKLYAKNEPDVFE